MSMTFQNNFLFRIGECVENVSIFIGLFYTIKKTGRIYSFIFYGSV